VYDDPRYQRLDNPLNDAKAIAKELEVAYGFEQPIILENKSKKEILTALKKLARKAYWEDDQLFIFFAGHGTFDEVFKEGYIVTRDSRSDDETRESFIQFSVLRNIVDNIPCKHILLTLDVCFGGTFSEHIAKNFTNKIRSEGRYEQLSRDALIARKMKHTSRLLLASSESEVVSDGQPGRHSPFAFHLLEALRSYGGKEGYLTFGDINKYVEKVKPGPLGVSFGSSEPGGDFLFIASMQNRSEQTK
jgi:hypothetical protein